MKRIKWTELLISVISAELVGVLSALLSGGFSERYSELIQPPFAPSGAVFPVVWTILYALMGISAYIIWQSAGGLIIGKKAVHHTASSQFLLEHNIFQIQTARICGNMGSIAVHPCGGNGRFIHKDQQNGGKT